MLLFIEFRLALIQLGVTANKSDNIKHAVDLISKAAKQGAQLLVLPVIDLILYLIHLCVD